MQKKVNFLRATAKLFTTTALLTLLVSISLAQPQGPGPGKRMERTPLAGLKHALKEAGAPELSSQQEEQLLSTVKAFHEQAGQINPDETIHQARRAYEQAIIAGDLGTAQSAANTIASAMAAATNARLNLEAGFKIQVLGVLKSNEAQFGALVHRFGTEGISRIVGSLFGHRGPGGPGGPDGPGGPPGIRDSRGGPIRQIRN